MIRNIKFFTKTILLSKSIFICLFSMFSCLLYAAEDKLKIIIPAEKNGGLDYIARRFGDFLNDEKIVKKIQYENIAGSGAGAAKGIEEFLKINTNENAFIVASLGMYVNEEQGNLSQKKGLIKKLKPLAIISEDYPIIAVNKEGNFKDINELMNEYKEDSKKFNIYGGSLIKGLDHINFLVAAKKYNVPLSKVKYIESSGGGQAFERFIADQNGILSTSFSENIKNIVDQKIKVLAICSTERLKTCPNAPTFKELGINDCLSNFRIVYANSDSSPNKIQFYNKIIHKLFSNPNWVEYSRDNHIMNLGIKYKEIPNFIDLKRTDIQKTIKELNEK